MAQEPQFGTPVEGANHRDRPAAFGILHEAGKLGLVRISLDDGTAPYLDLPGGAIDPGETDIEALVREFAEETGLAVAAGAPVGRAAQYFQTTKGEAVNNRCAFFAVSRTDGSATKVEDDHELVWIGVDEALGSLRHDAHAWGVCAWLRSTLSKA